MLSLSFPSATNLVSRFIAGKIEAFEELIEDHELLSNENIYESIKFLNHDACHDLSIALAESSGHDSILLFTDDAGLPIHSALYLKSKALILDGNGVQSVRSARRHWRHIGGATRTRPIAVDDLAMFSDPDADSVEFVMTHFNKIAEFVEKNRLICDANSSHDLG